MSSDVRETMDPTLYVESLGLENLWLPDSGDQCLILPDIAACFKDCEVICLPYPCPTLAEHLAEAGKIIRFGEISVGADGVYWGTPTVVNNQALFDKSLQPTEDVEMWTKDFERTTSRIWAEAAQAFGLKVIVTGLGTGDISCAERLQDMGGGHVVSHKMFDEFEDWVLMRRL